MEIPFSSPWPAWAKSTWRWGRWLVYIIAWAVCLAVAQDRYDHARHEFDTGKFPPEYQRADGNSGHTYIDFGGQWVMGRMIVSGRGNELYNRNRQWEVVREGYPHEEEHLTSRVSIIPTSARVDGAKEKDSRHDADALMTWLMGKDPPGYQNLGKGIGLQLMNGSNGNPIAAAALTKMSEEELDPVIIEELKKPVLGGALYPPIHGFFYAFLGSMKPHHGYLWIQWISLISCFISGYAVQVISRGKIWLPIATAAILLYPGARPGLDLGQNHMISLAIVTVGWACFSRDREILAGLVWGLLAFKPVWAIAFLFVPMLMGRLRFFLAMCGMGAFLIVMTLPVVGLHSWFDWLNVGKLASGVYSTDTNWIRLSRDLAGLQRRLLVNPDVGPVAQSDVADLLAWLTPGLIMIITAGVYLYRADRAKITGVTSAFVISAAYLGCFRFMYYDSMLSSLAFIALFANPKSVFSTGTLKLKTPADEKTPSLERRYGIGYINSIGLLLFCLMLLNDNVFMTMNINWSWAFHGYTREVINHTGGTKTILPALNIRTDYHYPVDTYLILILWFWCGWRLLRDGPNASD